MAHAMDPIRRFIVDASWCIRSVNAAPGSMEQEALRAEWLAALQVLGITEDQARKEAHGLWRRAPSYRATECHPGYEGSEGSHG